MIQKSFADHISTYLANHGDRAQLTNNEYVVMFFVTGN